MRQGDGIQPDAVAGRCALIVDDDPVCRRFCADVLRDHGFDVAEAADGTGARALARRLAPDVIVCDLRLPDPAAQAALFRSVSPAATGVRSPLLVVMSADGFSGAPCPERVPDTAVRLHKPFSPPDLLAAVRAVVDAPGRPRAGVRDEAIPATLVRMFRAGLGDELEELDACITARQWRQAARMLHRLRGAAAMSGYVEFAECCARLRGCLADTAGRCDFSGCYLELLRMGEDLIDAAPPVTDAG